MNSVYIACVGWATVQYGVFDYKLSGGKVFRHYFDMVWRQLWRRPLQSLIYILGLSIAMTACLFIFQYAQFETHFDAFHSRADSLYRVESRFLLNGSLHNTWATSSSGYAPAMKEGITGIAAYARLWLWDAEKTLTVGHAHFLPRRVFYADPAFLRLFSFPMASGSATDCLEQPGAVVLTASAAKRYFGDSNPLGRRIEISDQSTHGDFHVTGIVTDPPADSHIQFDLLISWASLLAEQPWQNESWYWHEAYSYVLLEAGVQPEVIEAQFPALAEQFKTRDALRAYSWGIDLVPLKAIHLNPQKSYEREAKGSRVAVWGLLAVGVIMMVMAWVNGVNLSTALASERAAEVGVRKVLGARRRELLPQFLMESVGLNIISLGLAVAASFLLRSRAAGMMGVPQNVFHFSAVETVGCVFFFLAGAVLFSGYPAVFLSGLGVEQMLGLSCSGRPRRRLLRQGLVFFQCSALIVLLSLTLLTERQLRFMWRHEIGARLDKTLVVKAPVGHEHSEEKIETFRNALKACHHVHSLTGSSTVPGREVAMFLANRRAGEAATENQEYEMLRTDEHFIPAYGLKVLAGRGFLRTHRADDRALVVNEAAMVQLGFRRPEAAIGEKIMMEGAAQPYHVIGVVENYHHQSLRSPFQPMMLMISSEYDWIPKKYYSIRYTDGDPALLLDRVESIWQRVFPASGFDSFFLEGLYRSQYCGEQQFEKLLTLFSGLTLIIALMGLAALISLLLRQRLKETAVRKVLGAGPVHLFFTLSREMLWLFAAGVVAALPVAFFLSSQILNGFAFRISLSAYWWVFLLAVAVAGGVLGCCLLALVVRAMRFNPAVVLKSE